jgi:phage gpG-like protein
MLKVNLDGLKDLVKRFDDPALKAELNKIPSMKGVAAIISQAIADNFEQEGPGWAPLKVATLRASVKKSVINKMKKRFLRGKKESQLNTSERSSLKRKVDSQLIAHEKNARTSSNMKKSGKNQIQANRKILQKTGLLKKTATIPGFTGSSAPTKGGKSVSGSNLYSIQGTNLVWGTNLVYAGVHNNGDPSRGIPKREFMVIRDAWKVQLNNYIAEKALQILTQFLTKGRR